MYLYKVMARLDDINGAYRERVFKVEVEEKPKTYVGKRRRINKSDIGMSFKDFKTIHTWVDDEDMIDVCRMAHKKRLMSDAEDMKRIADKMLESIQNHDDSDPIEISEDIEYLY